MTNFTITSAIFNEIEDVHQTSSDSFEKYYDVLYQLAKNEIDTNKEYYDSESDYHEAICEEIGNLNTVNRISQDGILYQALIKWHNRNDVNSYPLNLKVLENVRSAVLYDGYLYYVTGYGYDAISSDLLGGNADGEAKKEFLKWINS